MYTLGMEGIGNLSSTVSDAYLNQKKKLEVAGNVHWK